MQKPWEAERELDTEEALGLVAGAFPELEPRHCSVLGVGWDNTAFLVDETWVFRFPRRAFAVPFLKCEAAALPALAERLPLAVPAPVWIAESGPDFPWPFVGYRHLDGETACARPRSAALRGRAAAPLGAFLRTLHGLDAEHGRRLGLGPDGIRRLDLPYRAEGIRKRLEEARTRGWLDDVEPWLRLAADVPADWTPSARCIVHGDLYARHVLVGEDGLPVGVIDWGDVHVGDPAIDLALAWSYLPAAARAAFRASYGPIEADAWRVARFRALHSSIAILVYGEDVGDAALAREGRAGLSHVLED